MLDELMKPSTASQPESWVSGKANAQYPHVITSNERGKWVPEEGFGWVDKENSWEVVWQPGTAHSHYSNVIASADEGNWKPALGYDWVDKNNSWAVAWKAGMPITNYPNVVASETEGYFQPAPGYGWIDRAKLTVQWNPGKVHTTDNGLISGQSEGEWITKNQSNSSEIPKYRDYPVDNAYIGSHAEVVLSTDKDRAYRTRLREASKSKINFAGEFIFATWGCGTSCATGAIVSAKTGAVFHLPFSVCCWKGPMDEHFNNIDFRINSRLVVFAGLINEDGTHGAHFYEFTGTDLKHIKTIPVAEDSSSL